MPRGLRSLHQDELSEEGNPQPFTLDFPVRGDVVLMPLPYDRQLQDDKGHYGVPKGTLVHGYILECRAAAFRTDWIFTVQLNNSDELRVVRNTSTGFPKWLSAVPL